MKLKEDNQVALRIPVYRTSDNYDDDLITENRALTRRVSYDLVVLILTRSELAGKEEGTRHWMMAWVDVTLLLSVYQHRMLTNVGRRC